MPRVGGQIGTRRSTRDQKLDSCVRHIAAAEGVPAFRDHVNDIMSRTLNIESSSRDLARIILKDVGLTSKILRIANSALFNRSGRRIMSVAHAITLLGWDNVRSMLSAIRFVEHFAGDSPGLRELMMLSVLNAIHSRDVAAVAGHAHPDEAYICGLLRNLGEVLVACHYPQEYARIILDMHTEKMSARNACLRHLDFHWDDLGRLMAETWNMPERVGLCMRGTQFPGMPADRSLASIADFAFELTNSIYRRGEHYDAVHLRSVLTPDGSKTLVSPRDLSHIVNRAIQETDQTFSKLGIPRDRLLLAHQAERAHQIVEFMPTFTPPVIEKLESVIDHAARSVDQGTFELTSLITTILDAVCAAGFDYAVFGLLNESHTIVRGRLASGEDSRSMLHRFHFPVDRAEGPIRAALVHKTDVLVDRKRDDRFDRSALVHALDPVTFALLPVVTGGRAVACLYVARAAQRRGSTRSASRSATPATPSPPPSAAKQECREITAPEESSKPAE